MQTIEQLLETYLPDLTDEQSRRLLSIAERLTEVNRVLNLTSLTSPEEIALLHFYDSLSLLRSGLFVGERTVLDVGCGGGFPSLPLAACTSCRVTANDATAKKLRFVEETAKDVGIANLSVLCGRAEELGRQSAYREKFDVVVSRGVARMNVLCEWCLPFVSVGGWFVAMKGRGGREELAEAENAIRTLGGEVSDVLDVQIPLFDRQHTLLVVRKCTPTDETYPRSNGRIQKKPL